jgi:glutathione S-transferase
MVSMTLPVFYSFRRCPYAMRARLALQTAHVHVELREVVLRDKPDAFLTASPSGTVPCLVTKTGVIDESLDIMVWALKQGDPRAWLEMPAAGWDLIAQCDGPFKHALDRAKYATRYPQDDPKEARARASKFLDECEKQLDGHLFGRPTLADAAVLPFVRQFAFIDKAWFDAQPWPKVQGWLDAFLQGDLFGSIMQKYAKWEAGDAIIVFPDEQVAARLAR